MSSRIAVVLALVVLGTPPLAGCGWLDADTVPDSLSSHPSSSARAENIEKQIRELEKQ